MAGTTSLQDLASKIGGQVESAKNVTFSSYSVPGMGQEPRLIGMIPTLQKGQMSIPLEGQTGVFVIMVNDVVADEENADYSAAKLQLEQLYGNNSNRTLESLKEKFGVKDNRHKYY